MVVLNAALAVRQTFSRSYRREAKVLKVSPCKNLDGRIIINLKFWRWFIKSPMRGAHALESGPERARNVSVRGFNYKLLKELDLVICRSASYCWAFLSDFLLIQIARDTLLAVHNLSLCSQVFKRELKFVRVKRGKKLCSRDKDYYTHITEMRIFMYIHSGAIISCIARRISARYVYGF